MPRNTYTSTGGIFNQSVSDRYSVTWDICATWVRRTVGGYITRRGGNRVRRKFLKSEPTTNWPRVKRGRDISASVSYPRRCTLNWHLISICRFQSTEADVAPDFFPVAKNRN
jgi:hypothetical protein